MRTLFLLALTFCAQITFSQNAKIQGTITDASTGETLPGVTIKSGARGTASNIDGLYALELPAGNHELTFTFVGYTSKSVTIRLAAGENKTLDVALGDANNLLQQTTVTAGKYEKPLGEVTVSLEVIKPKIIESVNTTSVDEGDY
ncbi:MAG: carboxypeptidase-like regulatory domain-containing protein [Saprospiraceae bacterium]